MKKKKTASTVARRKPATVSRRNSPLPGKRVRTDRGFPLTVSVDHFGDSLVFEFVRKTNASTIQKLGLTMLEFSIDSSADRISTLGIKYDRIAYGANPYLISQISLTAVPSVANARNFAVSFRVAAEGLQNGDVFRVMSSPPQLRKKTGGVPPPVNPNVAARVYLRSGNTVLASITAGGVPLSWKEFPLSGVP